MPISRTVSGYASKWINNRSGRIFARSVGGKGPTLLLLTAFRNPCDVAIASRRGCRHVHVLVADCRLRLGDMPPEATGAYGRHQRPRWRGR